MRTDQTRYLKIKNSIETQGLSPDALLEKDSKSNPFICYAFQENDYKLLNKYFQHVLTLSEEERVSLLSQKNADGYPMAWMAFQEGKAETVQAYFDAIQQAGLSTDQIFDLLSQKSTDGYPMARIAFQNGHTETVQAYCEAILQSSLKPKQKVALLSQKDARGTPMARIAFQNGHTETVQAYCEAILQSSLKPKQKVTLLSQKGARGYPIACVAFHNGHTDTVQAYCDAILQSGLLNKEKAALLSQKNARGTPMAWMAFQEGKAETVQAYFDAIQQAGLSTDQIFGLLSQKNADGYPMAWMAFENGHADTVKAYFDAIQQAGLSTDQIFDLLSQKDRQGDPMAEAAFQEGKAETVQAYCSAILSYDAFTPDQKIQLLSQKKANHTPMTRVAFFNGHTDTVQAYFAAILDSDLQEEQKARLLLLEDKGNLNQLFEIIVQKYPYYEAIQQLEMPLALRTKIMKKLYDVLKPSPIFSRGHRILSSTTYKAFQQHYLDNHIIPKYTRTTDQRSFLTFLLMQNRYDSAKKPNQKALPNELERVISELMDRKKKPDIRSFAEIRESLSVNPSISLASFIKTVSPLNPINGESLIPAELKLIKQAIKDYAINSDYLGFDKLDHTCLKHLAAVELTLDDISPTPTTTTASRRLKLFMAVDKNPQHPMHSHIPKGCFRFPLFITKTPTTAAYRITNPQEPAHENPGPGTGDML